MSKNKNFETRPLVSIVTPSYNSGRFIEESIKSVSAQDYSNIEHIIQDGGSTDQTKRILKKYQKPQYRDRIKIFIEPDKGPAFADNKAFLKAKGDIILVLNADDVLMPNACSWAVKNLAKNSKVAAIYGDVQVIDEKGNDIKTELSRPYNFIKLICSEIVLPAQATFIRRTAFEDVGFYFDESLRNCGDYDLWIRIGLRYPIKYVRGIVTKFRWHSKSYTRNAHLIEDFIDQKKLVLDKLIQNPKTPQRIKGLKEHAYAGLYFWAASMAIDSRAKYQALKYLNQSLMIKPSEEKLDRYISYWKQAIRKYKGINKKNTLSTPLVSIVTPSYNSGRFIENCIQSVLNQDYPNIEHIIQDGGSTDQTKLVLGKYQKLQYQHRIKIFREPDNGQSDALNRAIQKTKGEVILVLNADDMLMPYACTWGVEQMKKYPEVGVVYGDVYIINDKGEIYDIYKAHEYSFEELLSVELVPPAQATFVRRSALEKVGFYADSTLDTCPDYEMWIRIAQKFPMRHVWGVVTKYRHHDTPQLDSKNPRTVQRFVAAKKEVMDRVFKNPKTSKRIRKLLRRSYAGLDFWAYRAAIDLGQPIMAYLYIWRSFLRYPNINTFGVILKVTRIFSYFALLRAVRFLRRGSYAISKRIS